MTDKNKSIYLFVVPFFPSETCHGGSYIYDQVRAVKASGRYRVIVLLASSNLEKDGDYTFEGVEVYRFKECNLPSMLWPGFFDRSNFKDFDKCLERLHISAVDIAVVHAHVIRNGAYAVHIKRINPNTLTILQHHGYDVLGITDGFFANFGWHKRHAENYGVQICNNIDLHVGVSNATLDYLYKYEDIKIKDSYVLYNGVDKTLFHPLQKSVNSRFTVGCVANFWKIKDQIILIKSVETLVRRYDCDIKAILVGTGATLKECKEYVKLHNLSEYVEFRLPMPHDKLIYFYNSLDLFVLPSYFDTLGCVYLEAYACGVPFMAAEGTGIRELIPESDRDLWIAPKSDYISLAGMIKNYMDHKYKQRLTSPIDIQTLVTEFLDMVEQKRQLPQP